MKKIMFILSLFLIFVLLLNINGCVPVEETQEKEEIDELGQMEEDLNPDNLGDLGKEIDDVISW